MNLLDLLTPWLTLVAILIPLVYVEKWIHSHLYGVGWLLTKDDKSATALYYVLLFPGVFLHEFTQYLMAGALNVKIKRIIRWPQAQKNGTLRLDFVQIQDARWFQAAIIGATPLIVGLAFTWVISSQILSLDRVVAAIQDQDGERVQTALKDITGTPDFFLWLYLIFAISNAMLPTPADREGWSLLGAIFASIIGVLLLIGVGDVLYEKATGPLADAVEGVATAFAMVLVVEIPAIIFIGFLEEVLERITKRKFPYNRGKGQSSATSRVPKRVPGSNLPLPPGAPMPSIYNLHLPVPDLPKTTSPRRRSSPAAPKTESPQRSQAAPLPRTEEKPAPASTARAAAGAAPSQPEKQPSPVSATARSSHPSPAISRPGSPRSQPDSPMPDRVQPDRAQSDRAQPDRPQPDRARPDYARAERPEPDRAHQERSSARPADRAALPPADRGPIDERRARPLSSSRQDESRPGGPDRTERDRTPFARPTQTAPQSPRTRPEDAQEYPDRHTPRARPAIQRDDSQDDDRTQRLERTGRFMMPTGSRPRPDAQRRPPSPFLDDDIEDDMEDDDELQYEDDPDVAQDYLDDDDLM